jgi:hypothetical protein
MKKSVILSVLGLGLAGAATTAFGQGGIVIGNYRTAYNEVVWDSTVPDADGRAHATEGVLLTLWYGEGVGPSALTSQLPIQWNAFAAGNGYLGYYGDLLVALPDFQPGDIYSFQVRAGGDTPYGVVDAVRSVSPVWQESLNIGNTSGNPPGPPGTSQQSIGFVVYIPEPSTFALAGLGAAAMMIFRRRH